MIILIEVLKHLQTVQKKWKVLHSILPTHSNHYQGKIVDTLKLAWRKKKTEREFEGEEKVTHHTFLCRGWQEAVVGSQKKLEQSFPGVSGQNCGLLGNSFNGTQHSMTQKSLSLYKIHTLNRKTTWMAHLMAHIGTFRNLLCCESIVNVIATIFFLLSNEIVGCELQEGQQLNTKPCFYWFSFGLTNLSASKGFQSWPKPTVTCIIRFRKLSLQFIYNSPWFPQICGLCVCLCVCVCVRVHSNIELSHC